MGQGLGLALKRRGYAVTLIGRTPKDVAPSLSLHTGDWAPVAREAALVLIATPDDQIELVAAELARLGAVGREQVVLHLSGLLDKSALAPLAGSGAALGSFHPLQTVVDATSAAERLKGAYAGVEGDEAAIVAAERLANTLRMTPLRIESSAQPSYHAGAAIVSNYVTVLLGMGERLAVRAGVAPELAAKIYLPLLQGAVTNLTTLGPAAALTGPIRRGDSHTLVSHLEALEPAERRMYRELGLVALGMARESGLDAGAAKAVEAVLTEKDGKKK
jgi:predicted short-subunit dehydrogenase-like oxidoreductase (DUF2520 family)